jgi:acyl-CoA synthetase (AMP-forming)/AMP-acid ligase II
MSAFFEKARAAPPFASTVLDALERAARERPEVGITLLAEKGDEPPEVRSYSEVLSGARRRATQLVEEGVGRGDRVILVLPTGFDFVETFLGLQLLGAIPVPTYPPMSLQQAAVGLERVRHVAEDAGARFCLTIRSFLPLLGGLNLSVSSIEGVLDIGRFEGAGAQESSWDIDADAVALVQYTSGSTGDPKGICLTHRQLVANCHSQGQAAKVDAEDVLVCWLPLYHDLGLVCSLHSCFYWRTPMILMPPQTFLLEPTSWLRAISKYRGTISQAPNFAYSRCVKWIDEGAKEGLDLSSWRVALVTAEPVNPNVLDAFASKFKSVGFRREALCPAYGLAECTAGVTFPRPDGVDPVDEVEREALSEGRAVAAAAPEDAVALPSLGWPLPGHEVRILAEDGTDCPERAVGEVLVRGPSLMEGYWQRPEATLEVIRDGWFYTGDLGYLAGGELYVCGRRKDLIIVRGRNYDPQDFERAAESVEGVRQGCVVAFGTYDEDKSSDAVVLICETRARDEATRTSLTNKIRSVVTDTCLIPASEIMLVPPGSLPKTSSGKLQRRKSRQLWAAGELAPKRTRRRDLAKMAAKSGLGFAVSSVRRRLDRK